MELDVTFGPIMESEPPGRDRAMVDGVVAALADGSPGHLDGPLSGLEVPEVGDAGQALGSEAVELQDPGDHLLIWDPTAHPSLAAKRHEKDGAVWWYCRDEAATIQLLRSRYRPGDPFVFEGRFAVATTTRGEPPADGVPAKAVERRHLALQRQIQKMHTYRVIIWQNCTLPRSRTNLIKPDPGLWVGPQALRWLEDDPSNRWIQVVSGAHARGYLLDLVP